MAKTKPKDTSGHAVAKTENTNRNPNKPRKKNRARNVRGGRGGNNRQSFEGNRGNKRNNDRTCNVGASSNNMVESSPNSHKNEDQMILQRLKQFVGPTYEVEPIPREEIKFSNRNRLYVGNLPNEVTENDLKEIFAPFGEIAEAFIDNEKNFAFVKVDYKANAEKATRGLNGVSHKGRKLRVNSTPNATSVKVHNLDPDMSNAFLYRAFEIFGPVEVAVIIMDESGHSTSEGIVEFARKKSALSAIRFCKEQCLFLTDSLRPCIVEAYEPNEDVDRFTEKRKALKQELLNNIKKLDAEVEKARYEHETELMREELKMREQNLERQKIELEIKERNASEKISPDEDHRRANKDMMEMKMHCQGEELRYAPPRHQFEQPGPSSKGGGGYSGGVNQSKRQSRFEGRPQYQKPHHPQQNQHGEDGNIHHQGGNIGPKRVVQQNDNFQYKRRRRFEAVPF